VQAESEAEDFIRAAGSSFAEKPAISTGPLPAGRDHHRAAPAKMVERPTLVPCATRPGGRS
jgi:hypothetical protein